MLKGRNLNYIWRMLLPQGAFPNSKYLEKIKTWNLVITCSSSSSLVFCLPAGSKHLSPPIFLVTCSFFHLGINSFPSFMSSNIIARFLLRGRFPTILPSIISFKSPFLLNTRPIHFFFLFLITSIIVLFSFTISNTCSFVILSLQFIFSIFLHIHNFKCLQS